MQPMIVAQAARTTAQNERSPIGWNGVSTGDRPWRGRPEEALSSTSFSGPTKRPNQGDLQRAWPAVACSLPTSPANSIPHGPGSTALGQRLAEEACRHPYVALVP